MDSILAENSLYVMYFGKEDGRETREEVRYSAKNALKCAKLQLKTNIAAYIDKKEIERNIEPMVCNSNLIEKVTSNYIITKEILSNLSWQEKLICKVICSTWYSAVNALQREQLSPEDFVVDMVTYDWNIRTGTGWFKQSGIFHTEPLVIFTFANTAGFSTAVWCKVIMPCPCGKPCKCRHLFLDLINHHVNAPKNCMLTIKANHLVYRPQPSSITYGHSITEYVYPWDRPFVSGLFIPKIPDVGFKVLNIKSRETLRRDFYDKVKDLCQHHIIKGVLVYVTEKYLLHSVEEVTFINYIKDVQPDVSYGLGGCIVEDVISEQSEIKQLVDVMSDRGEFISQNLISIGIFTVPKNISNGGSNFEMYSFIIESREWAKPKIQQVVTEFSKKVPRFEHSIAFKFSCIGRDKKHVLEQDLFRAAFPTTTIIGCYGNGELGLNHPEKSQELLQNLTKKHRRITEPQFSIMYSYSTVFVYIGWGKITSPRGPV